MSPDIQFDDADREATIPDGNCPVCTKELDDDGWCFECRELRPPGTSAAA